MTSFKVLIAEDEPIVSHFIAQIISPMQNLEVLAICSSGEDAKLWITPTEPHVLITDIRMRGISGLELIRNAKAIKPDIRVIIISGYGLFEYAKEAMKIGIDDYLLKPIDPNELCESLRSIETSLAEQYNENKNKEIKQMLRNGEYSQLQESFNNQNVELMLVSQSGEIDATMEYCLEAISQNKANNINVAIYNHSVLLVESLIEKAPKVSNLSNIGKWLLDHRQTKTFSIISTLHAVSSEDLPKVLPELYNLSREERVLGQQIWHRWPLVSTGKKYANRQNRDIPASLLSGNLSKAHEGYVSFFHTMSLQNYTVWEVRASIYSLIDEIRSVYAITESMAMISDKLAESIKYADNFTDARDSTWMIIQQIAQQSHMMQSDTKIDLQRLYDAVSQYLLENCTKNESLQQIANRFHVSQPYVSRAFRIYANMSYKEFCMKQKIEIAQKLILTRPTMMFKDVANHVGIEPSYFSTVFHRLTGEHPSEYKARIEKEN